MKLHLLCVGRLTESYLQEGCKLYADRLPHYLPLTITELKEQKTGKKPDLPRIIAAEGEQLLQRMSDRTCLIGLDERGKQMTSVQLADFMQKQMLDGTPELSFVIGGPFGLSEDVRNRADRMLSLSTMTLTHQMARLVLLEQLYRACTIIRNEPYHHA